MSNFVINPYSFTSEFSPSDISDMVAWYDASDSSTITKDGSDRVSQWDDKSANGHDLAQSTSSDQPLWVSADKNGLDVINLAGDRWMSKAFTEVDQPITTVGAFVCAGEGNLTFWDGITAGYCRLRTVDGTNETMGINAGTFVESSGVSGLFGAWSYMTGVYSGTSSLLRINGSNVTSGTVNAGTEGQNGFLIGAQKPGSGGFWNQKVGEVICYNKVVSGDELTNLETYLVDKWDL